MIQVLPERTTPTSPTRQKIVQATVTLSVERV